MAANVRIIASSTVSLIARVEKGEFRSDLYYALSVLSLEMLPLRRHRGDILGWTAFYLDEWQEKYKRYVHLTQGAQRYLQEYEWPGNLDQLNSVCERLVLLTQKRNIACIVNLHQLDVALKYSTRIIGLSKGEIVFDGRPEELDDATIEQIYGTSRKNLMIGGERNDQKNSAHCA